MSERRTASALAYLHPDFCFIMDDDSMESAGIRAGDIVAFTACDHAEDSQIVAVQTDSAVCCFARSATVNCWQMRRAPGGSMLFASTSCPARRSLAKPWKSGIFLNGQRKEPTMKRNDLRAMGLTPDQINTIMTMNGTDINREKAKAGQQTDKEVQRLRESCITLLELLDDPKAVRGILLYASRLYSRQERRKSQEGQQ